MKNLGSINDAKSILTKEYGDSNYASQSVIATLTEQVRVVTLLADESDFKAEANFRAYNHGFDYLCIETFHDTDDIDATKDDGATVIANYYDAVGHLIHKTGSGSLTIQSRKFTLEDTPYDVLILADYEGTGSINLYFSKNDGNDWTSIPNDTLTHINSLVQKNVRIRVELVGDVILKNIAWGCK